MARIVHARCSYGAAVVMDELEHILKRFMPKGGGSEQLSQEIMHPHRDWLIALCITVALAIVLIGFNIFQFIQVGHEPEPLESRTPAPAINRELLRNEVERFDERRQILQELRTQKPIISQP